MGIYSILYHAIFNRRVPVFPTNLVSYLMSEIASCRRSAIVSILAALAMIAVCLLVIFGGVGIRQAYADETENIAFSVPSKVPFAVKADGTIIGPSASAWRIENEGTRPLRIKDVASSGFNDGSTVSAVSEAMPVADTSTRGIWSVNASRGGASLEQSVDGTIEIPVGGSAGFTWNANSPDDTKHVVAPAPMVLGTVSFTLGGAEPIAFAVYSDDDKSLDFYKRLDVPEVGDTFEGKTVTKVYTGIETDTYVSRADVPWADHKADIVKVEAVDRIQPVSMARWFDMAKIENPKVTEVDLSKVSTGACKSIFCLFQKAKSLRRIDGLQNWDTSSCTTMKAAFSNCSALQSIDVSNWNTSKASDLSYLFRGCSSLQSLDVSGWNTSSCTTMNSMFRDCLSLESLNISRWDTSKVTTFKFMFAADVANKYMKLRTVGDLSGWNTSNVTDMYAMFQECDCLESIGDISGWNTAKVTYMNGLFNCCVRLGGIGDLSGWNTSNVTDMDAMFQDCEYLESIGDISNWNTSKVTNMAWLFNRCVRLDGIGDLSGWNTSHNNNFESMFRGQGMTKTGMEIDVSFVKAWDVRSATDISTMFMDCTAQEALDLSGWDISSVKDMSSIFDGMTGLRKISLPASWKWIGSTGTAGYLPTPSSDNNIHGADGKWYSVTTGQSYAPADIPLGKADTYVASKELLPKVAFAVYSADDSSLDFYKRVLCDVPVVGSTFEGKTVTDMYTGIETEKYVNFDNDEYGNWYGHEPNTPWWPVRNAIRTVKIIDSGITPASIDYWFYQMENLSSIDVQKLDTSRCSDFFLTFGDCSSLTSIDVSSWSTQSLINLNGTFLGCVSMKSLNLGGWETSNVVSFHCLFYRCRAMSDSAMQTAIDQLEITENATNFNLMFEYCDKLNLDCSNWNVRADANHDRFNDGAPGIILPKAWQAGTFAVYSEDDDSLDFYKRSNCELPTAGDTFEGKTVTEVYTGIETTRYTPIDYNDSNGATNVPWYNHASDCKSVSVVDDGIKPINLAFWFHRFKNCISFDVSKLDTSSTSGIEHIFYDCENVKNLDLLTWDLSHCESAVSAFAYCYNLESIEFGSISTANFKSYGCYWMFSDCSKLSLDCSEWVIDPSAIQYAFNSGAPNVIPPKTWK